MSARKAMTPVEQDESLRGVGADLLRTAPDDWVKFRLVYSGLADVESAHFEVMFEEGRSTGWVPPLAVLEVLRDVRSGMYAQGRGTWYTAYYEVERAGGHRVRYDYDNEPYFDEPRDAADYLLDLEYFPRDDEHVPDWLMEKLEGERVPDTSESASPWSVFRSARVTRETRIAPGDMSPEEMMDTVQEIGDRTIESVWGEWSEIVVDYKGLVGLSSSRVSVRRPEGGTQWDLLLPEVGRLLGRLRTGMYQPGKGTWFTARLTIQESREIGVHFDHQNLPEFDVDPDPRSFHQDMQYFPRSADHLPDWLLDRLSAAQSLLRADGQQ
ncbi:hypothetical protein ACFWTE_19200 [Nocardiopsis sp. NPDC058631]|uniref:hypothetical protein n=1 Tax=Nocardiopsis sp. NPDC058631 TaxID=3346566 RepID=UPI003647AC6F